ncbi:perivitellin-2 67 kDa subunit-like [Mytilus edulis]|uniref:perivitellin-2 67 kDa subunit-like n=1 Tax=Mytilus edulis TaxID=6550 RepID=UPI0039EEDC41
MKFRSSSIAIFSLILPNILLAKYCVNIPPFLSRLRDGVDITKLDLLPLDWGTDDGFKNPVIDFTCNGGQMRNINNKQYDIPDQVWSIIDIPNGLLSSKTEIQKTSHGVKQSMGIKVDVGYGEGIFSSSGSYKTIQNYITNSSRFIEDVTSYTSGYKIILKPYWALEFGQIAQMYIDKRLPKIFNDSTSLQYMEFIKSFGTHIFNHGKFGGLLRLVLATDESYYLDKTDSQVEAQAKATFFNTIKLGGGGSSGTQRVDEAFTRATRKDVRYYGGTTNLIDTKGITAWQPTVERNPWLFGGSLTEISGMIADISKQQSMKRAVQVYMDKAYLKELLRIVARYYTSREWDQHRHVLMNYNKQVNSMLQHNLPDHNAIVTLAKTIENATVIPGWFRSSRICYNWYADGDNGQCSEYGEQTGLLCANVNQWTGYYRDDTDRGNGGCLMRWGIMSSGYDDWFKNVSICYKWGSESDGGQCGSGTSGVTCANVNSYTDYYKDDTDRRAGGCYMQWMLSVPTSSPLWIQNAEICYKWDSDGDREQCGRGVSKILCAKANTYTEAYRDDSDRRTGGCSMSWRIKVIS